MNIVFQAPCRGGLGHVNRLACIADEVRRRRPEAHITFVNDGNGDVVMESFGFDFVRIGEKKRIKKPDVIVYDCFPHPEFLRKCNASKSILILREMSDERSYIEKMEKDVSPFLNHFTVIRPKNVFRKYTLGMYDPKIILICGGSGGFPETLDFYNRVILAARDQSLPVVLIAGPAFRDWEKLETGAHIIPWTSNMMRYYEKARIAICQAGYNTMHEVAAYCHGKVFIAPQSRLFDDQYSRFHKFRSEKIDHIGFGLREAITQELLQPDKKYPIVDMENDSDRIACEILKEAETLS